MKTSFELRDNCRLIVQQGDITQIPVDAIVNAANPRMLGGGGVDGAIHLAAGPQLEEACQKILEVQDGMRCPRGEARITPGFNLPSKYVIHTVGPVYETVELSSPILESAHRSALRLAKAHEVQTISFPAISCGIYGFPVAEAAEIAIRECNRAHNGLREIRFVLFGSATFEVWLEAAQKACTHKK